MLGTEISIGRHPLLRDCIQKALQNSPSVSDDCVLPLETPFPVVVLRFEHGGQQHAAIIFNDAAAMLGRTKSELPCGIGQHEQYVKVSSGRWGLFWGQGSGARCGLGAKGLGQVRLGGQGYSSDYFFTDVDSVMSTSFHRNKAVDWAAGERGQSRVEGIHPAHPVSPIMRSPCHLPGMMSTACQPLPPARRHDLMSTTRLAGRRRPLNLLLLASLPNFNSMRAAMWATHCGHA